MPLFSRPNVAAEARALNDNFRMDSGKSSGAGGGNVSGRGRSGGAPSFPAIAKEGAGKGRTGEYPSNRTFSLRLVPQFDSRTQRSPSPRHQIITNEGIEIAVQYPVHIPHLKFCPMVLDQPVGLQRVGADLAAKADVALGLIHLARFSFALLDLGLVQARAQPFHGKLAVLVLAAFVLALHDNPGGQVRD